MGGRAALDINFGRTGWVIVNPGPMGVDPDGSGVHMRDARPQVGDSHHRGTKGPGQSRRLPRTAPPPEPHRKGTPHPKAAKLHPAQSPLPKP
jgi:hypothetical protein